MWGTNWSYCIYAPPTVQPAHSYSQGIKYSHFVTPLGVWYLRTRCPLASFLNIEGSPVNFCRTPTTSEIDTMILIVRWQKVDLAAGDHCLLPVSNCEFHVSTTTCWDSVFKTWCLLLPWQWRWPNFKDVTLTHTIFQVIMLIQTMIFP